MCQDRCHTEWLLLVPAILKTDKQFIVLINPPTRPFAPALLQLGIDLDRLVVVEASRKSDFLMSFLQMSRSPAGVILAWQPKENLSYTDLRKCQLACLEGQGLYCLFRPADVLQQSSPAGLRIQVAVREKDLAITVRKQRGMLTQKADATVSLPLPRAWTGGFQFHTLDQKKAERKGARPKHPHQWGRPRGA